ncbi:MULTISPECIES: DUF5677 domain-containing protein [Streptococcus]|uniref:DUF5677 domain-containing protein n=1 Tax=Streptococcus TaxID=1301 RepID=UPI002AA3C6CB|nr:SEC-C domain-containing protein [Streptococcus suis]
MEKEIGFTDYCPCRSGKSYERCCKLKNIKWTISDTTITRTQLLDSDSIEILDEIQRNFKELYGREVKGEDYIFNFVPNFRNESILRIMETMRMANISEEIIYAYFKTDGLLPIEELNVEKIPDGYLQEFNDFVSEYEEAMSSESEDSINAIQYVAIVNEVMEATLNLVSNQIIMCLTDFIYRHTYGEVITDFQLENELDYCMFSALKTIKTLESVSVLKSEFVAESIYALGRSIFENYLYLCAIHQDKDFFKEKMYPKIDSNAFEFEKYSDGRTNYNRVINLKTGEIHNTKVLLSDLKNKLKDPRDRELYYIFYQTACQFVHVDILSAKSYFKCNDPYDELNQSLVASIIINALSLLLLKEICKNREVQNQFKIDCEFLTNQLSRNIVNCLKLIQADKEKSNLIISTLLERFDNVEDNSG